MDKQQALAKYLDIDVDKIKTDDFHITPYTEYKTPVGTYLVMDEDESWEACKDYIEGIIDDMGIEAFTPWMQTWIADNAIDNSFFYDIAEEHYESYANDIEYETDDEYGNRLNQECIEAKIIRPKDIVNGEYKGDKNLSEELTSYLLKENENYYEERWSKWYIDNYGQDDMTHLISRNPSILDIEVITDKCIELDGFGHNLSSWDGKTIELDGKWYAYKQDNKCEE